MDKKYSKRLSGFLALVMMLSVILVGMPEVAGAEGDGTWENPYTVAQAISNNTGKATVAGYIVGQPTGDKSVLFENFTGDTAIAIADSPDETDTSNMLYIQIPSGNFRTAFGLKTNPNIVGQYIKATGSLEAYFVPHPGLKSLSAMEFAEPDGGDPLEPTKVANVTATPKSGTVRKGTEVILQTSTEDATVYYTVDDTDPTTDSAEYSVPIIINEDTTIKAIAVKEGLDDSDISTFEYTIVELMNIAEARAKAVGDYVLVEGIVTFVDGGNNYIQDETAGIDVFIYDVGLKEGDKVSVFGKIAVYNKLIEIVPDLVGDVEVISEYNELPALKTVTIADVNTDAYQGQLVKIENVTIGNINTAGNTLITDEDGNSINIYKIPELTGIAEGDRVNVIAIASIFNNPQLRVRYAADITKVEEEEDPIPEPEGNYPVLIQNATKTEDKLEVKLYNFEEDMDGIIIIKVLDQNGKPYIIDYTEIMNITKGGNIVDFTLDSAKYTRGISGVKVYVWQSFDIMKPFARQKTFDL